jgi:hypothetical protein
MLSRSVTAAVVRVAEDLELEVGTMGGLPRVRGRALLKLLFVGVACFYHPQHCLSPGSAAA